MPKKTDRKLTEEKAMVLSHMISKYTSQGFVSQRLDPPITQGALSQILARKLGCTKEREGQIEKIVSSFEKVLAKFAA